MCARHNLGQVYARDVAVSFYDTVVLLTYKQHVFYSLTSNTSSLTSNTSRLKRVAVKIFSSKKHLLRVRELWAVYYCRRLY
jgi:hypothetical protein